MVNLIVLGWQDIKNIEGEGIERGYPLPANQGSEEYHELIQWGKASTERNIECLEYRRSIWWLDYLMFYTTKQLGLQTQYTILLGKVVEINWTGGYGLVGYCLSQWKLRTSVTLTGGVFVVIYLAGDCQAAVAAAWQLRWSHKSRGLFTVSGRRDARQCRQSLWLVTQVSCALAVISSLEVLSALCFVHRATNRNS